MEALICDICGGKLIMGKGGIATCESCGMKYDSNRLKEKVQEVKGKVQIDSSNMIDNYLEMATNANDVGNLEEAESYCNKVIEIDTKNYKAWMLKGRAVALQSSLQNSRISEGVTAFAKGINYAPEEEKQKIIEETKEQIKEFFISMISLRIDRFSKWPDDEEWRGFNSDMLSLSMTVFNFITQTKVMINHDEIMNPIAKEITQGVVNAWQNVVWPDYEGDPKDQDDRPGKDDWRTFISRVDVCVKFLKHAIDMHKNAEEDDIQRYETLIIMQEAAINSCSWEFNFNNNGEKNWYRKWILTDESKEIRREEVKQYKEKIEEIKASIAAKQA